MSMTNVNVTTFRKNLFGYIDQAIEFNDVINVVTKKGNAVVLSESDYNSLIETLYLSSIPGLKQKLIDGKNESIEDCEEFEW